MPARTLAAAVLAAGLALPTADAFARPSTPSVSTRSTTETAAPHARAADRAADRGTVKPRADKWETKVLRLTNARRKAHGVKPLKARKCPDHFAETWTRHMARTGDFEHQSLDPFFRRCDGIRTAGENIAYGYETPRALVRAWMHSPGHRANILNPRFHRIGISGWRSAAGTTYATQDFVG
jgi:uncharacterized protein YkwD